MLQFFQNIINWFANIPNEIWLALGAALGVSTITQIVKHRIASDLSDRTIMGILTTLSAITAAIQYFAQQAASNPTVLGVHTATILGLATLLYPFTVKPFYNLMLDAKAYREAQPPPAATTTAAPSGEFSV